jgi:glutathione S-transferase
VAWQMRTSEATARACLAALPGQLDRVDALLAEGVIGGERPNAADFQIAPSVRLMLCFDQLRDQIDARPAGAHARRYVPDYPGRFREVFPAQWPTV